MKNTELFSMKIEGISMYPYLKSGDRIWVDSSKSPGLGDLILFKCAEELVVHRFLGEDLFKGDYQKMYDQEFGDSCTVLGTVTHHDFKMKKVNIYQGFLMPFLIFLSHRNHHTRKFTHRLFAAMIRIVGHLIRKKEKRSIL